MPQIDETAGLPPTLLNGPLAAGIADISQQTTVTFQTYTRRVLPLDGYVFWLRTGQFQAQGYLAHTAERSQDETDTVATDHVSFVTTTEITQLNESNGSTLYVGVAEGVSYAFRSHGWFNDQAGVWHYAGNSVVASLATQLINDPAQLDPKRLIVSNSLPAWLALATYNPVWLVPANPGITLYPSFLVPENLPPPFGAVHIHPEQTQALSSAPLLRTVPLPLLDGRGDPVFDGHGFPVTVPGTSHTQLATDFVRVTLYGADNPSALAFLDLVNRYSVDQDIIGMMSIPTVRDDKRTWPEGMIIAQMKHLDFQVSYVQSAVYYLAQQLIHEAQATVIAQDPGLPINPNAIIITS